jgi:hydrogenase maturation protease
VSANQIVILGVGNILEKDDGIGVYATHYLEKNFTTNAAVQFINGGVEGINLLNIFLDNERIIILDTIALDDTPGSIYNIPSQELGGMGINAGGAHEIGVLECLDMIELLSKPRPEAKVLGIVPAEVTFEIGLSPTLASAFESYINAILDALKQEGIILTPQPKIMPLSSIIDAFKHPEKTAR